MVQGMDETPLLVITGAPGWIGEAKRLAAALGWRAAHYAERAGYVARLADDHAALIMVDGADTDWRFWTTTPKASPATRRVPVVVVSDAAQVRAAAVDAGADFAIPADFIGTELPAIMRRHARVQDAALREALREQCAAPLPDAAREAIAQFNAGEYYRQHDLLEALWVEEQGPVRDLYRAILQVGVAYYQVTRGSRRGALKMLLRAIQWLNILPDVCQGVDVRALREDALRVRDALERMGEDGDMAAFDRALLRPVRLVG
jgi:hypothetical protein